jgi:hypothetical protein
MAAADARTDGRNVASEIAYLSRGAERPIAGRRGGSPGRNHDRCTLHDILRHQTGISAT